MPLKKKKIFSLQNNPRVETEFLY